MPPRYFSVSEQLKDQPRFRGRPPIALALRCGGLLALLALTGCGPGILPSQGIVGKGDTTIMIDSLAIMLAIVVPTIVATLAFAWWFRSSNSRARHRPDFVYSGQIEMITWSIPLMTIMLLGGVAWRGSHDLDPARPLQSDEAPLKIPPAFDQVDHTVFDRIVDHSIDRKIAAQYIFLEAAVTDVARAPPVQIGTVMTKASNLERLSIDEHEDHAELCPEWNRLRE